MVAANPRIAATLRISIGFVAGILPASAAFCGSRVGVVPRFANHRASFIVGAQPQDRAPKRTETKHRIGAGSCLPQECLSPSGRIFDGGVL